MLARSGPIPTGESAYEVTCDGSRALVSTKPYRVRSRRGWDMTPFLPKFAELRPHGVYHAELIAFGNDGRRDFPLVCERLLFRMGVWGGTKGTLFPHYASITKEVEAASDHAAIYADINL